MTASSSRPMGITILAVLSAIGGVFGILGGIALLGLGALAAAVGAGPLGGLAGLVGLATIIIGVADLALAYGFWMTLPWAWMVGIVLAIASIVVAVLEFLTGYSSILSVLVSIVVSGIILYYLYQPSIKALFGQK